MIRLPLAAIASGAVLLVSGCATAGPHAPRNAGVARPSDRITISVGPCFGFCPVFTASIAADGTVVFVGERNTAVLGERRKKTEVGTYAGLLDALGPFRPADGTTTRVSCAAAISDTSSYTITWTGADGVKATATHQAGCPVGPGRTLDELLRYVPASLGIAEWAKQTTRPGTSRG